MTLEAAGSHADVQRLCKLASLPRATYYRHLAARSGDAAECELRDLIQRICLKHRFYGYGGDGNAEAAGPGGECQEGSAAYALEDNLLAQRKAPFLKPPADRPSAFLIVPNLVEALCRRRPTKSGSPTSPMSGLPRVRLSRRRPRRLLAQGRRLGARRSSGGAPGPCGARHGDRGPQAAARQLIHHSDRGVQYASGEYAARLDERGIQR